MIDGYKKKTLHYFVACQKKRLKNLLISLTFSLYSLYNIMLQDCKIGHESFKDRVYMILLSIVTVVYSNLKTCGYAKCQNISFYLFFLPWEEAPARCLSNPFICLWKAIPCHTFICKEGSQGKKKWKKKWKKMIIPL